MLRVDISNMPLQGSAVAPVKVAVTVTAVTPEAAMDIGSICLLLEGNETFSDSSAKCDAACFFRSSITLYGAPGAQLQELPSHPGQPIQLFADLWIPPYAPSTSTVTRGQTHELCTFTHSISYSVKLQAKNRLSLIVCETAKPLQVVRVAPHYQVFNSPPRLQNEVATAFSAPSSSEVLCMLCCPSCFCCSSEIPNIHISLWMNHSLISFSVQSQLQLALTVREPSVQKVTYQILGYATRKVHLRRNVFRVGPGAAHLPDDTQKSLIYKAYEHTPFNSGLEMKPSSSSSSSEREKTFYATAVIPPRTGMPTSFSETVCAKYSYYVFAVLWFPKDRKAFVRLPLQVCDLLDDTNQAPPLDIAVGAAAAAASVKESVASNVTLGQRIPDGAAIDMTQSHQSHGWFEPNQAWMQAPMPDFVAAPAGCAFDTPSGSPHQMMMGGMQ